MRVLSQELILQVQIKFEKKEIDYKQTIFIKPIPKHDYEEKVSLLNFRINNPHIDYPFNFPNIIKFGIHDDFHDLLESIKNTDFDFHSTYSLYEEDKEITLNDKFLTSYYLDFALDFEPFVSMNKTKFNIFTL